MHPSRRRRGPTTTVATAALVLAACLGRGAGSSSGYPGASGGGASPPPRSGQPPSGGYPPQQQQQQYQQYPPSGPGQAPPASSQGAPPGQPGPAGGSPPVGVGGAGGVPQGGPAALYERGPGPGQQGYRGGPPPNQQQQRQQPPPQGYGQAPQNQGQGGGGGGGYGGGGYPGGQPAYGGRPGYPSQGGPPQQQPLQQQQQQPPQDGGGLLSRLTNKLKGTEGQPGGGGGPPPPGQQQRRYDPRYGGGGGGGSSYSPPQGPPPQGWQPPSRPGMSLQPTGPSRGPIQSGYQGQGQGQDGGYGGQQPHQQQPPQHGQQYQQPGGGADGGAGIWSRFKGKVFQGEGGDVDEGPPSFRPGGSVLKKKEDSMANANAQAFGGPGAFGNPYPSFGGPPGLGMGQVDGATPEPAGPGVTEFISVEGSIVMVLKPNELAKKKRKFKQDGANRLQVIATFDHCLTAFHAKDGKTPCLKTTDALEQNQHVMLPEAAKKVRYLRSDFKRRMEADGKTMTPEERVAALEENLRKVYSVVAMEGGVHMNSIGPAIESQLDSIPLRGGVDDMTAALAWRAIPLTIFCAGYGNVAMEVLRRGSPKITGPGGVFTPHLRLVANFFRPDDTMTIIGMYDTVPLIHEAKKSGATLLEFLRGVRQENAFSARSNVVLLGSELSDLGLGNGLPAVEERISVGFLKLDEHVLDKLPRYAQAYDVVIIGDGDMSYANEILHEIVG